MGCDYYGPEPDIMPLEAPSEKTSTASGREELTPENPDDCCSSGDCADNKPHNHTDVPDCCCGKVSPCCDTSCLDRLAMRECGMSATATRGLNIHPNTCDGVTDYKACNQHHLSTLDRYGATLQALGCICRALIALS
ncbi:uncharacterized protein PGRI_018130 [Penicillium griseofulvum]|uniref:Uncharacterized protein n=1 Tax=Penicillium patulum TaxID=5078 RepID=A0A135LG61_PENPA|nr:uncharacterized protein PGRI_018130 [Penicillium griseofulvum]KXG47943.1 hypothetical protein PGRI_018130 [Penicillium griseofulvum]